MKIRLLDYANRETFCEIPDNTESITIDIISGDMVMVSPICYDSSKNRIVNFYDRTITLKKEEFHRLNEIESSYDL